MMNRNLTHLVYVSDAARPMSQYALDELVGHSQAHNADADITGVLMYGNMHFMQLLEGELHALNELYGRIVQDPRHQRVFRLAFYPVRRHHFRDWKMHLINLDAEERLDRKRLRQLLDRQAKVSLDRSDGFHAATQALLDEFQSQLMPGFDPSRRVTLWDGA